MNILYIKESNVDIEEFLLSKNYSLSVFSFKSSDDRNKFLNRNFGEREFYLHSYESNLYLRFFNDDKHAYLIKDEITLLRLIYEFENISISFDNLKI